MASTAAGLAAGAVFAWAGMAAGAWVEFPLLTGALALAGWQAESARAVSKTRLKSQFNRLKKRFVFMIYSPFY